MNVYSIESKIGCIIGLCGENGWFCNETWAEYIINKYKEKNGKDLDFDLTDDKLWNEIRGIIE